MKTLTLKQEFVNKAEEILLVTLGKDAFASPIPTKIETFEDVLKINGTSKIPIFSELENDNDRKFHISEWKWTEITKAYNKLRDPNYKADWTNVNQAKYWPWTEIKKDSTKESGFAFSGTYSDFTYTCTNVGSRHAFAHKDDVLDALKKFDQIWITTRIS